MDFFEFNKIAGAVLFTLLGVMSVGIIAGALFDDHPPETPGFVVEVAQASTGDAATEEVVSIGTLLASADAAAGEKVAKKCAACHTFDNGGANKVGPNLYDIVGKAFGAAGGFAYSDALKTAAGEGKTWSYEELNGFLAAPKKYLSGTTMGFAGLKKDKDRANMLAYLQSLSDSPVPFPEAEGGGDAEKADGEMEEKKEETESAN